MKLLFCDTVAMGRKAPCCALMAITIAVSAALIRACPQMVPPMRTSVSENGMRKRTLCSSQASTTSPRACTHGAKLSRRICCASSGVMRTSCDRTSLATLGHHEKSAERKQGCPVTTLRISQIHALTIILPERGA